MPATRTSLGSLIVILALCSCGGGGTPSAFGPGGQAAQHRDRRAPWLSPALKQNERLLFVSDAQAGDVYIYTLPTLKLAGTVTGFAQPQGLCSGSDGAVWVTDANARTIYELSHEGRLLARVSDSTGYPEGCAWDPSTGDLAVMNLFGLATTAGSVLVYGPGSGSPKTYQSADQYYYNFGGYDDRGDLYFDGRSALGRFVLSELPAGSESIRTIKIEGEPIFFPGMVQWDSKSRLLVVGDQQCENENASCVYRVSVAGKRARIERQIQLYDSAGQKVCDLVQGVVADGQITGSDNDFCGSTPSATYRWPYPGGGNPNKFVAGTEATPVGAAISLKHRGTL